jgi:hypothetical protein
VTPIPSDPIGIIIWLADLGVFGINRVQAFNRLKNGLAAQAQRENRDMTDEELALDKQLDAAAERAARGQTTGSGETGPPA